MVYRIFFTLFWLSYIFFPYHIGAETLAELKARAEAGNAQAQYAYAEELGWNFGSRQMAAPWWRKSAEQSYPYAIIAVALNDLIEISKNYPQEIEAREKEYFEKNCSKIKKVIEEIEKEHTSESFYNLGDVYSDGICVKADEKKALDLYQKAAEMGLGSAQSRLADIYGALKGQPEGVKWLKLAAQNDMIKAKIELASLYLMGKGVGKDEKKAASLIEEVEASNSSMGLTNLALLFFKGKLGFPKNSEKAKELVTRAADMNFEPAVKLLKK